MKAYYIVDVWDKDELDVEDASEIEHNYDIHGVQAGTYDDYECEWLVDEISKYYYHNRDGWEVERTWRDGITIAVWDENKNFIGKFNSMLEYEPTFWVTKAKNETDIR